MASILARIFHQSSLQRNIFSWQQSSLISDEAYVYIIRRFMLEVYTKFITSFWFIKKFFWVLLQSQNIKHF